MTDKKTFTFIEIFKISVGFLVGFLILYLIGAFYQANLNIIQWTESCRCLVAFVGLISGIFMAAIVRSHFD